ncbi:hypothetical protein ABV409_04555 [Flagellimonas sp. DF-77]|uniref:hypothetical protein n=1 Tax=Flagellimonas algarum TaxID=3230298 RepID=UPI00339A9E71
MKTLFIIAHFIYFFPNINDIPFFIEKINKDGPEFLCKVPTTIEELSDGVVIDAYDFADGDEKSLGLLGFFNVNIKKHERVTVVEYLQRGSMHCNGKVSKFGIGARMMMRVTSHNKKARLDTPQQITASVIFGHATVKFSMHTFGITGPGIADLNQIGSINENTYASFISGISELLAKAYDGDGRYIIKPQRLRAEGL